MKFFKLFSIASFGLLLFAAVSVEAQPLRPVRVITFTTDASLILARLKGFFIVEGLDVSVTTTNRSGEQMRGLSKGTWDIASTAFDNVLAWSGREGAEIIAVALTSDRVNLPFFVLPEIETWTDLKGKKLAVDAVDTGFALVLRRMLLTNGLDLNKGDYELLPVGPPRARFESLTKGETFGAILSRPWDTRAAAAGMRRLAESRDVLPDYPGAVFAVNRAWTQSNRDDFLRFLRGWMNGLKWSKDPANREEAIRLVASDQDISREGGAVRISEMPTDPKLNPSALQVVLTLRMQFGFKLPMGTELNKYYDSSFLTSAQKK